MLRANSVGFVCRCVCTIVTQEAVNARKLKRAIVAVDEEMMIICDCRI